MDWKPIEEFTRAGLKPLTDVLVWNGQRVEVAWKAEDGWYDSRGGNYDVGPMEPTPTHWMAFPEPPKAT